MMLRVNSGGIIDPNRNQDISVVPEQWESGYTVYLIEVQRWGDDYVASVALHGDWLKGVADTPEEALYTLCEVLAECGLHGERTGYPPKWWRLLWFDVLDAWYTVLRWLER